MAASSPTTQDFSKEKYFGVCLPTAFLYYIHVRTPWPRRQRRQREFWSARALDQELRQRCLYSLVCRMHTPRPAAARAGSVVRARPAAYLRSIPVDRAVNHEPLD